MGRMGRIAVLAMVLAVIGPSSFAQPKVEPKAVPKTMTFTEAIRAGYEIRGLQIGALVLQRGKSAVICEGDVLKAPCKIFE